MIQYQIMGEVIPPDAGDLPPSPIPMKHRVTGTDPPVVTYMSSKLYQVTPLNKLTFPIAIKERNPPLIL